MRWVLISLSLAAGWMPTKTLAQEDVRAAARAFEQGQQAQLSGDYARAAELFELAHRSAPAAAALRAAIRNHRAANAAARAATLSLLAIVNYAADTETRTLAEEVLRENESRLARVELTCSSPCEVLVDERVVSWEGASEHAFFTTPGERRLRASFGGGTDGDVERTLALNAGQVERLSLEAPATPDPEPDPDPDPEPDPDPDPDIEDPRYRRDPVVLDRPSERGWSPIGAWVSIGVTAALGATLVWSLVDTFDANDEYEANPTRELYEEGRDKVRRTWILGVTTGLVGAATVLIAVLGTDWYGSDEDDESALRPTLDLGTDRAGLGLEGRF